MATQTYILTFSLELVFLYLPLSLPNVYLLIGNYDFESTKYHQDVIRDFSSSKLFSPGLEYFLLDCFIAEL